MNEAEYRELARVAGLVAWASVAFHALVFGSLVVLLSSWRRWFAQRSGFHVLAWTSFTILALIGYASAEVPASALDDHLLFWKTGMNSICHLRSILGRLLSLFGGASLLWLEHSRPRWVKATGGVLIAATGAIFTSVASYRWATFPAIRDTQDFIAMAPVRDSLVQAIVAGSLVLVVGCLIANRRVTG